MSGNARVFKTGTPGQLGHLTMNLTISDHIIGFSLIFGKFMILIKNESRLPLLISKGTTVWQRKASIGWRVSSPKLMIWSVSWSMSIRIQLIGMRTTCGRWHQPLKDFFAISKSPWWRLNFTSHFSIASRISQCQLIRALTISAIWSNHCQKRIKSCSVTLPSIWWRLRRGRRRTRWTPATCPSVSAPSSCGRKKRAARLFSTFATNALVSRLI